MSNLVSYTGDTITYRIPVTNDGPHPNTNVLVDNFVLSGGQTYQGFATNKGTFDPGTMVWTIGDMTGNQEVFLELYYLVADINLAPFTLTATVSGDINNNPTDDDITLSVASTTAPPSAGGIASTGHGGYVEVSENDTQCTNGITEWRLKPGTINGIEVSWNELTGQGVFKYEDFTKDITGTYDLFCVVGVNEYLIAPDVIFTIPCLLNNVAIFNHTLESITFADLTNDEKIILQNQWPDVVLADFCWNVLKDSVGTVTSGLPLNCGEDIDDKLTIETIVADIDILNPSTGVTFPINPEDEDIHTAILNNGQVYFIYDKDNTNWIIKGVIEFGSSFSGVFQDLSSKPTLIQNAGNITGSINLVTETFTLTAPIFSGAYGDLTGRPIITASGGNVTGTLNLDTGVLTLIGAGDDWGIQVIQHEVGSFSSGDGTVIDPLDVTVTPLSIGLGNIDNTSDVNKPVSAAQQLSIDTKQNTLVSTTNIKTVNGNTLLGSGDLVITPSFLSSGNSQRFTGAIAGVSNASELKIPFPKPSQLSGDNLKSIAIYASSITGDIGFRLDSLGGGTIANLVYVQATGGVQTFIIDDVDSLGYEVILSESAVNTSLSSLVGLTLYYAPIVP